MRKRRRPGSAPRIRIHADGRATLSGLHYSDLRSILTAASLHHYDTEKQLKESAASDPGSVSWAVRIRKLLALCDATMDHAIRPDVGIWKSKRVSDLGRWERGERLRSVRSDISFRRGFEELIATLRKAKR